VILNCFHNRKRDPWWRRRGGGDEARAGSSEVTDPSRQYAARIWLDRALRALSTDERALIVLFELEQWTIAELADFYHTRIGTIKSRLSRARRKMRRELMRYLSRSETNDLFSEGSYAMPRGKTLPE
jgi:RNA polymerase sigma factor (sigma-70 family)